MKLKLSQLADSELNIRRHVDDDNVKHIAASIQAVGQLQPILVRPVKKGQYEVLAGKHRVAAFRLLVKQKALKDPEIEATVVTADDQQALAISTAENTQRADLTPLEECDAYRRMAEGGASVQDIAKHFGRSDRYVKQRLALAGLAPAARKALEKGDIGLDAAEALTLADSETQARIMKRPKDFGIWNLSAANIRHALSEQAFPVKNAIFDLKLYQGDFTEDLFATEETRHFADRGQAMTLQHEAAEKKKVHLLRKWMWVDILSRRMRYDEYAHHYDPKPSDKTIKSKRLGAVIQIHPDGKVEIETGLRRVEDVKEEERKRKAKEREARKKEQTEAGEPVVVDLTGPMMQHMTDWRNLRLAQALLADPHAVKAAIAVGLGQAHRPVTEYQTSEFREEDRLANYKKARDAQIDGIMKGKPLTFANVYALKPDQLDRLLAATWAEMLSSKFIRGDNDQNIVAEALDVSVADTFRLNGFVASRLPRETLLSIAKEHKLMTARIEATASTNAAEPYEIAANCVNSKKGELVTRVVEAAQRQDVRWVPPGGDFGKAEPRGDEIDDMDEEELPEAAD